MVTIDSPSKRYTFLDDTQIQLSCHYHGLSPCVDCTTSERETATRLVSSVLSSYRGVAGENPLLGACLYDAEQQTLPRFQHRYAVCLPCVGGSFVALSVQLLHTPESFACLVILHQLAHLSESAHGSAFDYRYWQVVSDFYRQHTKQNLKPFHGWRV